jgi:hypothetical protein
MNIHHPGAAHRGWRLALHTRLCIGAASITWALAGCASGARAPEGPVAPEMSLPTGAHAGETASLRARLRGTLMAWTGPRDRRELFELDLRTGERKARPPTGAGPSTEPDRQGRVAVGVSPSEDKASPGMSGFDLVNASGQRQPLVRAAEPARISTTGATLSFDGQRLAHLRRPAASDAAEASRRSAYAFHLWIAYSDGRSEPRRPFADPLVLSDSLLGHTLSWFPDSRHLAVVVQGPRGRAMGEPSISRDEPDAQVLIVDTDSGEHRPVGPGRQVWVSTNGQSLLVRLHEVPAEAAGAPRKDRPSPAWTQRPTQLVRRAVLANGGFGPAQALPHSPKEVTAVLAWLEDRYLVYRGDVTPGAPSGLTKSNSPLVGPKLLQAVKVMDTQTGEFLTVLEGVDPRSRILVR